MEKVTVVLKVKGWWKN